MKKYRDNMQQFYDDVSAHGDDLKAVQEGGQAFVNTAKVRMCLLIPDAAAPLYSGHLQYGTDPSVLIREVSLFQR